MYSALAYISDMSTYEPNKLLLDCMSEEALKTTSGKWLKHRTMGEVIDVDTTTVNTLFVVEGAEEEELLVPAQEEFIVGIDQKQKLITVELPEGLLNLEELEDDR